MIVKVLLPLAIDMNYSYSVPDEFQDQMTFGIRVEVQFGKKNHYTGLVIDILGDESDDNLKEIIDVLDDIPIITEKQYQFWQWISDYYMAMMGEVMKAALPGRLSLSSETRLVGTSQIANYPEFQLSDDEFLIAEALSHQDIIPMSDIQAILQKKSVYKPVQSLLDQGLITIEETLVKKYKPKKVKYIRFLESELTNDFIEKTLEQTSSSEAQTNIVLALFQLMAQKKQVTRKEISQITEVKPHAITALQKKGIIEEFEQEMNRLDIKPQQKIYPLPPMSNYQNRAYEDFTQKIKNDSVLLLHGVTGSGKTRFYLEYLTSLMKSEKGQYLFLVPEIGLTTQLISRIIQFIDYPFIVYHSRISEDERVDIFKKVATEDCFVIGARSALLLPFHNLNGIVIDEEHDSSYKQQDPSPRYQARDSSIMLARIHDCKTILGSATPSVESYYNAQSGKYQYLELAERFGEATMPTISTAQLSRESDTNDYSYRFSKKLISAIESNVEAGKQVILFQNRRGYAPRLSCPSCGWNAKCIRCDVSLIYHKYRHELSCHYCNYSTKQPNTCPECGYWHLDYVGTGTEKIEEELETIFPDMSIQRFDHDSVRSKRKLEEVLFRFENREIDILVGTKMVTKGLDFENVGLVGVISLEGLLSFPDFRTTERAFQTMIQVGGRAGRRGEESQVIIQTYNPNQPIIEWVKNLDYASFFRSELNERHQFAFPPFIRMIRIELLHSKIAKVKNAAEALYKDLNSSLGKYISPPFTPEVSYIKNKFQQHIIVKLPMGKNSLHHSKQLIKDSIIKIKSISGYSSVRINLDVDPY